MCAYYIYIQGGKLRFFGSQRRDNKITEESHGIPRNRLQTSTFRCRLLIVPVLGGPTSVLGQLPPERKDDPSAGGDQGGRSGKSGSVQGGVRFGPDEGPVNRSQVACDDQRGKRVSKRIGTNSLDHGRHSPKPLIMAIETARFSRPSKFPTIQLKNKGTAVQIPAPPKQIKAYLTEALVTIAVTINEAAPRMVAAKMCQAFWLVRSALYPMAREMTRETT
jgi:hypothetical protein